MMTYQVLKEKVFTLAWEVAYHYQLKKSGNVLVVNLQRIAELSGINLIKIKMTPEQQKDQYEKWKEVPQEEGQYAVILRPGSNDTNVMFYMNQEDMLWAMRNSWFEPNQAMLVKVLQWDFNLIKSNG